MYLLHQSLLGQLFPIFILYHTLPQKKLICPKNRLSELLILIGNLRATSDGYKKDNFRYKYARIVKML